MVDVPFAAFDSSLIDYDGEIAAVLFTQGCNLNCGYCHSKSLIPINVPAMGIHEAIKFLSRYAGKYTAIVVTGGEPCIHAGLPDLLQLLKAEYGLPIKLYTNGTRFDNLVDCIPYIDSLSVSYKGGEYMLTCDTDDTWRTFDYLKTSDIDFEIIVLGGTVVDPRLSGLKLTRREVV